jgi:endonuclease/exonuclease/phosphatase family metal-dependent hydrolase
MSATVAKRWMRRFMMVAVTTTVVVVGPAPAQATEVPELTVMTQNLYLGSSLQPVLEATDGPSFVAAVATVYGTVLFTNFPARAAAIADEIATERPTLIGLQEVSRWTATPTHAGPNPPSLDFLAILQAALAQRGLDYVVAAVSDNASVGPAPLVAPSFGCLPFTTTPDCVLTFADRDVVLVDHDVDHLRWTNPRHGNFVAQQLLPVPGGPPVSFNRGWASIDVSFRGAGVRFLTTHLETEDFPAVQEAQARELLTELMQTGGAEIAVGDFNSAADGSTTRTYRILTRRWLDDAWPDRAGPGFSCCQNGTLSNPVSQLTSRIDLVLTHDGARGRDAHLVGTTPFQAQPPFWPSDHAGVVAAVRLVSRG